jgi:PleD family two-component response regulator
LDFLRKYGYPIPEVLKLGKPKVVAVDDDASVLSALTRVLSRRFDLTTFQDPVDALVAVGNLQPDALVLDIKMPGLDGIRLLERLRTIDSTAHIRSIIYSSYEDMRKPALEAGAYDFIVKGEISELRDALERLMGVDRA